MKLMANVCGIIAGLTIVCMAAAPTHGQEKPSPTQGKKPGAVFKASGSYTLAVPVPEELAMLRFHSPLVEPDVRVSRIRLSDKDSCARTPGQTQSAFELNQPKCGAGTRLITVRHARGEFRSANSNSPSQNRWQDGELDGSSRGQAADQLRCNWRRRNELRFSTSPWTLNEN